MRNFLCFLMLAAALNLSACKGDKQVVEPAPQIEYTDLGNREIKAASPAFVIDANKDGRNDIAFGTLLVGDAINQVDKLQFIVTTNIACNLAVNGSEEIPVMDAGSPISSGDFEGYHWYELSSIVLMQKVTSYTSITWEGHWKMQPTNTLRTSLCKMVSVTMVGLR